MTIAYMATGRLIKEGRLSDLAAIVKKSTATQVEGVLLSDVRYKGALAKLFATRVNSRFNNADAMKLIEAVREKLGGRKIRFPWFKLQLQAISQIKRGDVIVAFLKILPKDQQIKLLEMKSGPISLRQLWAEKVWFARDGLKAHIEGLFKPSRLVSPVDKGGVNLRSALEMMLSDLSTKQKLDVPSERQAQAITPVYSSTTPVLRPDLGNLPIAEKLRAISPKSSNS